MATHTCIFFFVLVHSYPRTLTIDPERPTGRWVHLQAEILNMETGEIVLRNTIRTFIDFGPPGSDSFVPGLFNFQGVENTFVVCSMFRYVHHHLQKHKGSTKKEKKVKKNAHPMHPIRLPAATVLYVNATKLQLHISV
jgi:hypothetical protein